MKSVCEKLVELLLRGGDDLRMRVADVQAADAAGEVDEDVPVDVGDRDAPRASAAAIGKVIASGEATLAARRSSTSRERGPGIAVFSSIRRVVAIGAEPSGRAWLVA